MDRILAQRLITVKNTSRPRYPGGQPLLRARAWYPVKSDCVDILSVLRYNRAWRASYIVQLVHLGPILAR